MKKSVFIVLVIVIIIWIYSSQNHILKGFYQSDVVDGYHIQILFQGADKSFTEWIDNRQVDRGTYKEINTNLYKINSKLQNFEIELNNDNSFELIISKLNNGEPIIMKNITPKDHGMGFGKWDDVDKYKSLLD